MICAGMTCYEISGILFLIDRPYHDFPVLVSFFTNLRELMLASFIIKSSSRALQNEATDDYYYRKQCHDNDIRRKYSVALLMTDIPRRLKYFSLPQSRL